MRRAPGLAAALAVALVAAVPGAGAGGEVRFFRLQSSEAFRAGSLDGIAVDRFGTLSLSHRYERAGALGEPFVFAAARHPEGWVFGTGNAGRVLLARRDGEVRTLFEAEEPEVFALWVDPDGTVFAGTSPRGKVYRIDGDGATEHFDPGEVYIWDLARGADGSLLVATGTEGRLYRVGREGRGEVVYDSGDTHVRVVEALPGGEVLAGTAGDGLIVSIDAEGAARTLYDAAQPEVVALAPAPGGGCYAAVLASESSLVDLARRTAPPAQKGEAAGAAPQAQVTVVPSTQPASGFAGSRPQGFEGPRAEILRLAPDGAVESLWRFEEQTVYSLLAAGGRLWIGTGLDGELYSLTDGRLVLEQDVDERQVVAVLEDAAGPAFATANAAALYLRQPAAARRGVYTSPALDAGQIADFGSLRWEGALPRGARVEFSFRSGMSADPDDSWSPWTEPASGREVGLAAVPAARYLQWRAELADGDVSPGLAGVTISYRQVNLPPRIRRFEALDPGQILVPANFNPASQVFEPAHPSRDGIFTTLGPPREAEDRSRKTLWKRGFQTLRWQVEDPNGDELRYDLEFRPEGRAVDWLPLAADLEDDAYGFDATSLPDGSYRFRLRVRDRVDAAAGDGLAAEEVSEPVVLDHTPPRLEEVRRDGERLRVRVRDAASPLREAVVSIDARAWHPAAASDGILDGRSEELSLEVPADSHLVLLRVTDAAFNVISFDLSRRGDG